MNPKSTVLRFLPVRLVPLFLLVASIMILATALASEHWGGLLPCPLCLWQRWPYWVAIGLSFLAAVVPMAALGGWARAVLLGAVGLTFLVGAGLAGYHVGVEQGWWPGLAACGATGPALGAGLGADDLRQQLLATPVVRCDQVAWSLFGLSMAAYNGIASVILATVAWAGAIVMPRVRSV